MIYLLIPVAGKCPTSHPYTCGRGAFCSSNPWKPTRGPESDCDGFKLGPLSTCCPKTGVIPCNRADPRKTCMENHNHTSELICSVLNYVNCAKMVLLLMQFFGAGRFSTDFNRALTTLWTWPTGAARRCPLSPTPM